MKLPSEAILAITLNCNSHCLMCDVWKKRHKNEVEPEFYRKLPSSLREINISGGEPFLRDDIVEIIKVVKKSCPKARIVISTNGFLTEKIQKIIPKIINIDRRIGIRVSLDGLEIVHNNIRGVARGFQKALTTLHYVNRQVADVGVGFTLMEENKREMSKVWLLCQKNNWEFSLSLASNSNILFGNKKSQLQPRKDKYIKEIFEKLIKKQYQTLKPKNWIRAWFNRELYNYFINGKRRLSCLSGNGFAYIDSHGLLYACHLKPWLLGDLNHKSFMALYRSTKAEKFRKMVGGCHDCWLICSARPSIKDNLFLVLREVVRQKINSAI